MTDLLVLTGTRAGTCFRLPGVPTVLGRSPEAHLRLDDPWISNMHALFEPRGQELWVIDLGSRNGTFLGGERIEEARVMVGATLAFGRTEVRVAPRGATSLPTIEPERLPVWTEELRATVRTGRPAGEAAPVAEPSGAADPFQLGPRPLALVRLSLSVAPGRPLPDALALRAALEAATKVLRRHGGRTTRLGGAALVAAFGFGGPAPDDGPQALRAAEAVREGLVDLASNLTVRLAVDAGPAVAGMITGHDGIELVALGETAERVDWLVGAAGPGELLVGPGLPEGADPRLVPAAGPDSGARVRARRLPAG